MRRYSRKELLAKLKSKAQELGRNPKCKDIDGDASMPSIYTYYTNFGNINNALREAGLQPSRRYRELKKKHGSQRVRYTDAELLSKLEKKAKELGRPPTQDELNADDAMPSFLTYVHRFGSFKQACIEVGLSYFTRRVKYTDRELLDRLKKKQDELGRVPVHHDLGIKNNMPPRQVYVYRFGGLKVALKMIQREAVPV